MALSGLGIELVGGRGERPLLPCLGAEGFVLASLARRERSSHI